ncbi:MAG: phage major capsid protein [Rhizomicrobium sp.]
MKLETKAAFERKAAGDGEDDEIKDALAALTKTTGDAVKSMDDRMKTWEAELDKFFKKANRPRGGGPGAGDLDIGDPEKIEAERKNLNAFIRGEFKIMTVDVDPQAGYFVPDILRPTMTEKLYDTPTMLSLVRTEQWDGPGSEWMEPLKRALLSARRRSSETQAAQDTSASNPVGLLTVGAGESEALIQFSQKLIDDSSRDLASMAFTDMDAAFDRQLDGEVISGTGTGNQAWGFLNVPIVATDDATRNWGSIQYVPGGDAANVTADGVKNLLWGLRAPYRTNASFVMSSNTANAVDKLKNGQGDYIWRDQMTAGAPPMLLGFPVHFDENMPAVAGNALPIAFGNWKLGYLAVKKSVTRYLRDPYTAKPNIVLYGYKRQGGMVANSEAIKVMKIATS